MNNLRHVGIYVKDLNKMKDFYLKTFSMKEKESTIESGHYIDTILSLKGEKINICKLEFENGGMIELLKLDNFCADKGIRTKPVWGAGQHHVAIGVSNLDELYRELKNKDVVFLSAPTISDNGYAKVCFCQDPEGNYLELVEVRKR